MVGVIAAGECTVRPTRTAFSLAVPGPPCIMGHTFVTPDNEPDRRWFP